MRERSPEYLAALARTKRGMASFRKPKERPPRPARPEREKFLQWFSQPSRCCMSSAEITTAYLRREREVPVWTLLPILVMDTSCVVCGSIDVDFYPDSQWCVSCVGAELVSQEHQANDLTQDRVIVEKGVGVRHVR